MKYFCLFCFYIFIFVIICSGKNDIFKIYYFFTLLFLLQMTSWPGLSVGIGFWGFLFLVGAFLMSFFRSFSWFLLFVSNFIKAQTPKITVQTPNFWLKFCQACLSSQFFNHFIFKIGTLTWSLTESVPPLTLFNCFNWRDEHTTNQL